MARLSGGDYNTATMLRRKLLVRVIFALLLVLAVEGISLAGLWVLRTRRSLTYFPRASRLESGAIKTLDSLLNNGDGSFVRVDSALGFYSDAFRAFVLTKPRFKLADGKLVHLPNPLRTMSDYRRLRDNQEQVLGELGRNDFHFVEHYREGPLDFSPSVRLGKLVLSQIRKSSQIPIFAPDGRYETRSEAYELTLRIFDAFYTKVLENGALPVIVVQPDVNDQQRSRAGKSRRYEPMLEYFRSRGYAYVDALEAFEPVEDKHTIDELTVKWGHFSALGNDLVARHVLDKLVERGYDDVPAVKGAAGAERQRRGIGLAPDTNGR